MRHCPDGDFHYIGHFDKSADEIARMIDERVLAYVGPPHIFHSDNGRQFVNQLLSLPPKKLVKWKCNFCQW